MSKNANLAVFAVSVLLLDLLVWLHTGDLVPPSGEDAIWFHAGLLTLLIGVFIVEYRFTRPNDVLVNCITVFASTSTLSNPPYASWWEVLRWGAAVCAIVAMTLAWDPGQEAKLANSRLRTFVYQVVTRLGRAEVLFSAVFLLAVLSFFDLQSADTKIYVLAWAGFLLAANIDLPLLGKVTFAKHLFPNRRVHAVTHSFLAPSIVFCRVVGGARLSTHELVGFCQTPTSNCHCWGIVIGERSDATEKRAVIALLKTTISEAKLNERTLVVSLGAEEHKSLSQFVGQAEIDAFARVIGTVARGTNISQVRCEIFGDPDIVAGSLLEVSSASSQVYYQVFNGVVEEEQTISDSARAFVEGTAEQVGCWNSDRGGFETHDWVAKERSTVRLIDRKTEAPDYDLKSTEVTIGEIPNSNFPANLDLHDLVLYHTGILGVTGSGKSFLTFSLVEECAAKGIKAVCVDPSGDYQRYLHDAVLLNRPGSLKAFLDSPKHFVAIIETANSKLNPVEQTKQVAQQCLEWCKHTRTDDEILHPRPKVLVVLEEAHLLVPEWNFNPQKNLQDRVNETSQIVLQARKYGLGFLVVSQRTANVVKSVLNQCNTIFSFQAFDETGFEFLRNYMGPFHVSALPNLKSRHGIVVGKSSRSRRPIMVRLAEQARLLRDSAAPDMPILDAPNNSSTDDNDKVELD